MLIHLVRHGEVDNPHDVVYADIPGFTLSPRGQAQAAAAGAHLAARRPSQIVSSSLDRAVATARLIADATGAGVAIDHRLTEWGLAGRWRGATWHQLPIVFPGELEAYLGNPAHLPFSPESLDQLSARVSAAILEWCATGQDEIVFVSHEDPLHAARQRLNGITPTSFHDAKPPHASVITLEQAGTSWQTVANWAPPALP